MPSLFFQQCINWVKLFFNIATCHGRSLLYLAFYMLYIFQQQFMACSFSPHSSYIGIDHLIRLIPEPISLSYFFIPVSKFSSFLLLLLLISLSSFWDLTSQHSILFRLFLEPARHRHPFLRKRRNEKEEWWGFEPPTLGAVE